MIRLRWGRTVKLLDERPGAQEIEVEVEGASAVAVVYPELTGSVEVGDRVLLNTTAVALQLGTGGAHFVVARESEEATATSEPRPGRIMRLRYTPLQVNVHTVEEAPSDETPDSLDGTPVVWAPLHSMIGPIAAGAQAAGAERVVYVMTDGAALPAGLSRLAAKLRSAGLLGAVVSTGQAFGGDLESVSVFSGLLAARHAAGADVVVVGDGPGNTGTGSTWGTSLLDSAMSLNAAAILGGRPVAALRISFADSRARHHGVSHHSITALARVALVGCHVAVPFIDHEERRAAVWEALREAKLEERHQLVEATGRPALDLLAERGIPIESMGRRAAEDPEFFLAAGAAGILAGRIAARDRSWQAESQ